MPSQDTVGCGRNGIQCKNGGDDGGGLLISLDGVAPSRMIGVSASIIFLCTIKVQKFIFLLASAHPAVREKSRKMVVMVVVSI